MENDNSLKVSKMGRPKTEEYRKKTMRYSRIEDTFSKVLDFMESDRDKKLIMETLKKLRA